jgi:hypothetical protein
MMNAFFLSYEYHFGCLNNTPRPQPAKIDTAGQSGGIKNAGIRPGMAKPFEECCDFPSKDVEHSE